MLKLKKIRIAFSIAIRFLEQLYVIHRFKKLGLRNDITAAELLRLIKRKENEDYEEK